MNKQLLEIIDRPIGKGGYGRVFPCCYVRSRRDGSGGSDTERDARYHRTSTTWQPEYAIKQITWDKKGAPGLMEISMMALCAQARHPCLGSGDAFRVESGTSYIVQTLAVCDLCEWRKRKGVSMLHADVARYPLHSITTALEYLHSLGLIHGDVKINNILVIPAISTENTEYPGERCNFVLTDYSLTICKRWGPGETPYRSVQTVSHRPVEVWFQREYDERADMWALGCTAFELVFGELLFPFQNYKKALETKPPQQTKAARGAGGGRGAAHQTTIKPQETQLGRQNRLVLQVKAQEELALNRRDFLMNTSLNALCDWREYLAKYHPDRLHRGWYTSALSRTSIAYLPPAITPALLAPTPLISFILDLLALEPSARPYASQALRHPFFEGTNSSPNSKIPPVSPDPLPPDGAAILLDACGWRDAKPRVWEEGRLLAHRYMTKTAQQSAPKKSARPARAKVRARTPTADPLTSATCLYMAHKLVTRHAAPDHDALISSYGVQTYQVLLKEREICEVLEYRIHTTM